MLFPYNKYVFSVLFVNFIDFSQSGKMRNSGIFTYTFRTFLKNHLLVVKNYKIYVISVHKFSIGQIGGAQICSEK